MPLGRETPDGLPEKPQQNPDSLSGTLSSMAQHMRRLLSGTLGRIGVGNTEFQEVVGGPNAFTEGMAVSADHFFGGWRIARKNADGTFTLRKYNDQKGAWDEKSATAELLSQYNFSTATFAKEGRQPFRSGQEVYVVTQPSGAIERGWRVTRMTDGTWMLLKTVLHSKGSTPVGMNLNPDRIAHIHEIEGAGAEVTTLPQGKEFEFYQRFRGKLAKNASLLEHDFKRLFHGDLRQSNVGNCYLIAAFTSLKKSPYFEAIMRTSMRWSPEGYKVKFPLGGKEPRKEILVTPKDIGQQIIDPSTDEDRRSRINPVEASQGWKILEMAYVKLCTNTTDRRKIEGGFGHKALVDMMGAGVQSTVIHGKTVYESLEAGSQTKAIEKWLHKFHNGRSIATVNSIRKKSNDRVFYTTQASGKPVTLYHDHAYAIERVMRFCKPPTVTVKNPHDTSEPIIFTFEEFMKAFADISSVDIDFNQLFPA